MSAEQTEPRFYKPAFGHSQAETAPHYRYRCSCCGKHVDESEVKDTAGELSHGQLSACGPVLRERAGSHEELVAWLWEASTEAADDR